MNKILKLNFAVLIIVALLIVTSNVYALTGNITMQTSKEELEKGEEFSVNISITNIQSELGVVAFGATLEYEKESLTFVKMEGQNGYGNPTYNPENGKFVMENNPIQDNGVVLKMTFKVNENATNPNATIVLKDVMAADGTNTSIKVTSLQKSITIKQNNTEKPDDGKQQENEGKPEEDGAQGNDTLPGDTTSQGSNGQSDSNLQKDNSQSSNSNGKSESENLFNKAILPQAGENNYLLLIITGVVLIIIVGFCGIKIVKKR